MPLPQPPPKVSSHHITSVLLYFHSFILAETYSQTSQDSHAEGFLAIGTSVAAAAGVLSIITYHNTDELQTLIDEYSLMF
jgi:dihydroorotase-like cyclic amidohydrolase